VIGAGLDDATAEALPIGQSNVEPELISLTGAYSSFTAKSSKQSPNTKTSKPYSESGKNRGCDVRSHVASDDVEEVG
jgi:hypothetical protein